MANPTSNFNWQMPTASDLVTDLPADFEVFGQAVDTSLADLKGGTTDQVLAKNSNTDMDFKWVTSDDANAIQNSIVDAKGDLIAASANDTPARLAVGNNGETLVADSSTSTGLRYTAGTVQGNPVINSAMQVWQRGTSISLAASSGATYLADRWLTTTAANQACTISRQVTGDTTNLPSIQYALRYQRNSGQTGTGNLILINPFETINSIPFAGKAVTLSFYARSGANYSATSSALTVKLDSGTGTDQNPFAGYTGAATVCTTTATLTTTWQRFTATGTVSATATELNIQAIFTPTGTAGANDYYEITGVQIDVGSVALPFRTYAATIQGELAACQRYYLRLNQYAQGAAYFGNGFAVNTTRAGVFIPFPVTMRNVSLAFEYSGVRLNDYNNAYTISSIGGGATYSGNNGQYLEAVTTGLTQYRPIFIDTVTSGYLAFNGEL
jgi:hypothetical protein